MNATVIGGEENMTDYQYKSIMAMVHGMLDKCKTLEDYEDTKQSIAHLSGNLVRGTDEQKDRQPD